MEASVESFGSRPGLGRLTPELLCELHLRDVCRFAAMFSRRSQDADDLAQQAMLNAIRGLRSFDPARGELRGWLWRIVANTARDAARRDRTRLGTFERLAGLLRSTSGPEHEIERRANDLDLLQAIGTLGGRDRILVALRYGAGLSTAETGSAVGLAPASTQRALRRALDRLKNELEREP